MHFKPIKDFLFHLEQCHQALADLYYRLSLEATDDKVKLFLDFINDKEQLSHLQLHQYNQHAPTSLLDTWLDGTFDQSFPIQCQQMKLKKSLSVENVAALAMNFNIQLIELMQTAANNSATIEAEIALNHLTDQQEERLYNIIMASHEFESM